MASVTYKPEIDGLRAIAVLSVIIYHINSNILPSGFVGVDIFLVISGYLITSIIIKSYKEHEFSLYSFYIRRIKRIIPLTYFVLLCILLVGWFLSYPTAYRAEANSSLSALYFLANLRFALLGNYFTPSNDNPLLHLWSLSLEEQFYFIWPLVIGVLYKTKNGCGIFLVCIFLLVFSALCSFVFINSDSLSQFAYFVLPTRMMGLLVGAGLASINVDFIWRNAKSNCTSTLGVLLVLSSLYIIDKEIFPGLYTLIPCIGAALVIIASKARITKILLTNKLMTFIGKISFSLYMWHWPLLVFGKRFAESSTFLVNDTLNLLVYCVVLVLLATFSYHFIESLFRKSRMTNHKVLIYIFVIPLVVLTAISLHIKKLNGVPERYGLTDKMTRIETIECYASSTDDFCYLSVNEDGPKNLLLIGDSHAGPMGHFVRLLSESSGVSSLDASSGGCAFFSKNFKSLGCENTKSKISKTLKYKDITYIAIAKRYDRMSIEDVESLLSYTANLERTGYKVIIIKQVPLMAEKYKDKRFISSYLKGELPKSTFDIDMSFTRYNYLIDKLTTGNKNIISLDFNKQFIGDDGRYNILDDNGYPLYYDEDHLSAYGAEWLYHKYSKSLESNNLKLFLMDR